MLKVQTSAHMQIFFCVHVNICVNIIRFLIFQVNIHTYDNDESLTDNETLNFFTSLATTTSIYGAKHFNIN